MSDPTRRLPRRLRARLAVADGLRAAADHLDPTIGPSPTPAERAANRSTLSGRAVVPAGIATGRADLQLVHTPTGHYGDGHGHTCRCDSWRLAPHLRGRRHTCLCTDGPNEPSHLPAGAPPFIYSDRGRC